VGALLRIVTTLIRPNVFRVRPKQIKHLRTARRLSSGISAYPEGCEVLLRGLQAARLPFGEGRRSSAARAGGSFSMTETLAAQAVSAGRRKPERRGPTFEKRDRLEAS